MKKNLTKHLITALMLIVLLLLLIDLHDGIDIFGLYDRFHPMAVLVVWAMVVNVIVFFSKSD